MSQTHQKAIQDLYTKWASTYDQSFTGSGKSVAVLVEEDVLLSLIDPQPYDKILDIGCGTGRLTEALYTYSKDIEGVDVSEEMLLKARTKLPGVRFEQANIEEGIPFADERYDKVVSSLVFQFLEDIEMPLREIYRVLKPGGKAYITTFVSDGTLDWNDIEYKIERPKNIPPGAVEAVSLFRPLSDFHNTAKEVGFSSVTYKPLLVRENSKSFLTDASYEKAEGKWASVVLMLVK